MIKNIKISDPSIKIDLLSEKPSSYLYQKLDYYTSIFIKASKNLEVTFDNKYIADDKQFNLLPIKNLIGREIFAEMDIQVGWCFGKQNKLNGMEWHKSSEVIVACTDLILFLGSYFDIKNGVFDTKNTVAIYLKKGEIIELYPLTLHLAPINVGNDFRATIILPKGTNSPLEGKIENTLRAKNKWLLCHKENKKGIQNGGKIGIVGENLTIIEENEEK